MNLVIHLLLWLHFAGLGLAVGGGVALARVGPSLVAAPADQRGQWWPLETFFGRVGAAGMVVLLAAPSARPPTRRSLELCDRK